MAAIKENPDEMRRLMEMSLMVGSLFLLLNIYWYCFDFFATSLYNKYVGEIFYKLNNGLHLFASPYVTLVIGFTFFSVFAINEKGRKAAEGEYKFFNGKIKMKISKRKGFAILIFGALVYFFSPLLLRYEWSSPFIKLLVYVSFLVLGTFLFIFGSHMVHRTLKDEFGDDDYFNEIQQSTFPQCEKLIDNDVSVNIPTIYRFGKELRHGWINFVNPFRATTIMGTPGSGKSFAFVNEFIRQHLKKGFAMYVYDFKFPTLSVLVYNHFLKNRNNQNVYPVKPVFKVVNFDDPRFSNRINPIAANSLDRVDDAYESAYTIMMNLNRTWLNKQGDFFVESPINFLTAVIWYFRNYDGGKYCTLAHVIEWCGRNSADIISIMATYEELSGYMRPFLEALEKGVYEQLQGQVASVQIPLSRLRSHELYWVISGSDFSLDINNPKAPIILCTGNNPDRQTTYGAALSLINGRLVKRVNHPKRLKLSFIVDELPTIFFKGIDVLIATARSNKVSICLGYQDNSQLIRDYGDKEAKVIIGTPGNIVSGQVKGDTARQLQEMFGKNKQHSKSVNSSDDNVSVNISEKEDFMIPASRIAQLSQGNFVGLVADDVKYPIPQKAFHAKINLDVKKLDEEEKHFKDLPQIYDFNNAASYAQIADLIDGKKKELTAKYSGLKSGDIKSASVALRDLKKELSDGTSENSSLLTAIADIENKAMLTAMENNTKRINRELQAIIDREIEKINTNPEFKSIKAMRDSLLGTTKDNNNN